MTRAVVLVMAGIVAAQDPPRFRSGVDVVYVDVLVTDRGRVVTGLEAADFELRDSGVVQRIRSVTAGEVPVSMLLALDTSTSVDGPAIERLKVASHAALDVLGVEDRSALLTFSDAVTLGADWGPPGGAIRSALDGVWARGPTSLFDAAFAALTWSDPEPGRRSVVVLFSDGEDTSSWLPAHAVLDAARRSDAVVYAVTLGTPRPERRLQYRSGITLRDTASPGGLPRSLVAELADITGGAVTAARDTSELRETFTRTVQEFRTRYLLTYTPEGVANTGWHPIEVRLKRGRGTVTARRGYMR